MMTDRIFSRSARPGITTIGLMALAAARVFAAWDYPGCPSVTDADFKYEAVLQRGGGPDPTLEEPVKMAFDMDASGKVDIYYAERTGKLKRYLAATNSVQELGTIDIWKGPYAAASSPTEEGLEGLALDPKFKTNHWIYLYFSPATPNVFRIARYTITGNVLDMNSQKILIDIPTQRDDCCHTGGPMEFDAYGDLWIGVGNNTGRTGTPKQMDETRKSYSDEWGASSTAGLRGGVLRIHPDDSPKGYGIPKGNFGDYFATQARAAGNAALAAQYADTALVKPEIFVKGTRNAYTLNLDPVRRWVAVGDVGPDDVGLLTEEDNLFQHPVFAGRPYFSGNNLPFAGTQDPNAPTNKSKWNMGLKALPPAVPAVYTYLKSCAIAGPIYRYDGDLNSAVKLPPHFQRKWFIADFNANWFKVLTLDDAGEKVVKAEDIFKNFKAVNPIEMKAGPDGALYVISYAGWFNSTSSTSIVRISYGGTCKPALPKLETPASLAEARADVTPVVRHTRVINLDGRTLLRVEGGLGGAEGFSSTGSYDVGLYVADGRLVWAGKDLREGTVIDLPATLPRGILNAKWTPVAR